LHVMLASRKKTKNTAHGSPASSLSSPPTTSRYLISVNTHILLILSCIFR
jgi:hypothetical protein